MTKKDLRLHHQIIKFNTKDSLMEVNADCFELGKVQFHFHKYDLTKTKGNRILQEVNLFVSLGTALVLCQDILSGKINMQIQDLKAKGDNYGNAWKDMGGVSAKKLTDRQNAKLKAGVPLANLKAEQRVRADGKSLARLLKIVPSSKSGYAFAFQGECGAGEEKGTGIIAPAYGIKPDVRLNMALTSEQAKELAILLKIHIESFIAQKYVRMEDENFYK